MKDDINVIGEWDIRSPTPPEQMAEKLLNDEITETEHRIEVCAGRIQFLLKEIDDAAMKRDYHQVVLNNLLAAKAKITGG